MRSEPQFVGVSDPELFHLLCTAEDDHAPYTEFVKRFHPALKQFCRKKCDMRGIDPHVGETIAHEVFERQRKYKSFRKDHFRGGDGHKWVLAYLTQAASRLFLNHHNEQKRKEELPDTYIDELKAEAQAIDPVRLLETRERTAAAMKKLTKRELDVVLTDLEYKRHTKYLPDDVILALAKKHNVKPDTIRKWRQRAKEKLNKAFNESDEA